MTPQPVTDSRPPTPVEPAEAPRLASQRVLIVEDEKRLREMLCTSMLDMDLRPTAVSSGESALKLVARQPFALALIDLNLPGMDGLELCDHLRRDRPSIQVILLTGFGDLDAARRAIRLEVVDFLTKPCSMDDLENALNRARLRWLDRWPGNSVPPDLSGMNQPPLPVPQVSPAALYSANHAENSVEDMERKMILASLAQHHGNRQAAAVELGISVRKLYYRLRQYQRQNRLQID
jgi:DNA-binding NtrC family response regulator